jgi:NTE family protein
MSLPLAGKRVAVSLGASFMGYATHAGFLAALTRHGLRPVALGGSSAGAIAAGMHAAGLGLEEIRAAVLGAALPLSFLKGTPWVWRQLCDILTRRQPGFFDARGAVSHLETLLGRRDIQELRDPRLLIALTDLRSGEAVFAREGPLALAITASCAVPLVFSEMIWQGRAVVDGGVVHEAPVDPWFTDPDVDVILIHRIQHPSRGREPWPLPLRMIRALARAHHATGNQWLADRQRLARLHGKELLVTTTTVSAPSLWSRASRERCYAAGEAAAQAFLTSLESSGRDRKPGT